MAIHPFNAVYLIELGHFIPAEFGWTRDDFNRAKVRRDEFIRLQEAARGKDGGRDDRDTAGGE